MTAPDIPRFETGDALLVVDVQRDLCPGGSMAVPLGDQVVVVLNAFIQAAGRARAFVVACRDWHPADHVSFTKRGGPLREHCVQGTDGAAFHPALEISEHALIVSKGQDADYDPCSAFDRTGLESLLRTCGVRRIFVGGLAQDVCVRETVLDALRCGFKTHVLVAATRPMDELEGMRALAEMHANGAVLESYIPLAHDGD